jgi:hypothetical protein
MTQQPPIHRHAQKLARQLAKGLEPRLEDNIQSLLEEHPEWLPDGLEGFLEASQADSDGTNWLMEAYAILLGQQLELLRYQVDRGYQDAIDEADYFQQEVVRLAREGYLNHRGLSRIAVLLRDAKLPPAPELFEVATELLDEAEVPQHVKFQDISEVKNFLAELSGEIGDDPYEVAQAITEATYAMPPEALAMLADLMLDGSQGVLAEAVPLMILDDRDEARRLLADVLRRNAKRFTPDGLRRFIALRNWLPEGERSRIDQAVKTARRQGVECASWPESKDAEVYASVVDGSGAQGFIVLLKQGRKYALGSVLSRLGYGVLDAWCQPGLSKRERDSMMAHVEEETPVHRVSRAYLDLAVQNQLAVSQEHENLPSIGLLRVAETIGATAWLPQRLDLEEAISGLLSEIPREFQEFEAVDEILKDSAAWAARSGITDSWFEDDQEAAGLLGGARASKRASLIQKALAQVIQPRLEKWVERCFWTALWCKEGSGAVKTYWPKFLLLAKSLREGRPLKDISLMVEIAERTVEAARGRL